MSGTSAGARKGWHTRRSNERQRQAAFERRSRAAKEGWKRRRIREGEWKTGAGRKDKPKYIIVEQSIEQRGGKQYKRKKK